VNEESSDTATTNTMYAGSFIYKNNSDTSDFVLDYILESEGMADMNGEDLIKYDYFIKDHLGNTRVTFSNTGTIYQRFDY